MTLSAGRCLDAIEAHTRGLATAAEGHLDVRVEHCPDWSVGDLVHHLTEVHTFWEHVARTRPQGEPDDLPPTPRAADHDLVPAMLAAMERLVTTLRAADQQAPCWTWGLEENVWFITRHQVQEAAVHHWDAANATGAAWTTDPDVAADAVEEFLTHSVANRRWPNPGAAPLRSTIEFCLCSDVSEHFLQAPSLFVSDGDLPGTLSVTTVHPERDADAVDHVSGAHLLLWLYRRLADTAVLDDPELVRRFRAFTSTD